MAVYARGSFGFQPVVGFARVEVVDDEAHLEQLASRRSLR